MTFLLTRNKEGCFFFKSTKAPGPDGLHPLMYQKYWDIMGETVIRFCRHTFSTRIMDEKINKPTYASFLNVQITLT